jgi:hypothetical protein
MSNHALALAFALACGLAAPAQVTTAQYDNARTGANLRETILTPADVGAEHFGKVFRLAVDGDIYAQPLFVPNVEIPGQGRHNVVFVATEHNSVYAFDAEGRPSTPLWQVNLSGKDEEPLTPRDVACPFITPEIGITPTPTIDLPTGTIYVLARSRQNQGFAGSYRYVQKLHALAITTGAEKFGGPVEIKASVPGSGDGASGGRVPFNPRRDHPRAALLLANGNVYLTWGSACDVADYHGWVMAYDAASLQQKVVLNVSPDAQESGIWQGDAGPAADAEGNIYVATGNGKFDADTGGRDYGDTLLRLGKDLAIRDYFTPFDQREMNAKDADLGSGGPVVLPDQAGAHPHLAIVGGKNGVLYVLDRDKMGKFHADSNSHAVQTIRFKGMLMGAAAYWNRHVYVLGSKDVLRDFAIKDGQLVEVGVGADSFIDPGATPTISANRARDGIVWVIEQKGWNSPDRPAVLRAYDASNVGRALYNSEQRSTRDRAGLVLRFSMPLVVNGRVYVGTKKGVDVYGLM